MKPKAVYGRVNWFNCYNNRTCRKRHS